MSDEARSRELQEIWTGQPKEDTPVIIEHVLHRRSQQLHVNTRAEIVMSIGAALFFVAVVVWRLPPAGYSAQPIGVGFAVLWSIATVFRFRGTLLGSDPFPDAAATVLEFYRRELTTRRDHLRNAWLWHGPLLVAAVLVVVSFAGHSFPGMHRFRSAAPLIAVLVVWMLLGVRRRLRQAAEIQVEIDEIYRLEEHQ